MLLLALVLSFSGDRRNEKAQYHGRLLIGAHTVVNLLSALVPFTRQATLRSQ